MIIVPLAGPDFILSDGQVKAETPYRGTTLLQACLESRPWRALGGDDGAGYVFVLYDTEATRAFTTRYLRKHYPASRQVFLSAYTNGAAFSVLAGCSLAKSDETLVVDLADILYESDLQSPQALLEADPSAGAIGLSFAATSPSYSYLREEGGIVVEAREKVVISEHASAGTYIFKDVATYLVALGWYQSHPKYLHNGLYFICPMFNGVIANGMKVLRSDVRLIDDIKVAASR